MTDDFNDAERDYAALLRRAEEAEAMGYERGWKDGVEKAARQVEYHCDCTHADVPGIVRLLADPTYIGYLDAPAPPPRAEGSAK